MLARCSSRSLLVTISLGAVLTVSAVARVEARPNYKKIFDSVYPDVAKMSKTTCNVCHFGDNKKNRNHYGEALAKELKKPKVEDEQTIKDALKAIEKGDCKTGKWKERLDKGEWPCTCQGNKHDQGSYIERQLQRCESP